jgi:antitoxin ParD1/3/4
MDTTPITISLPESLREFVDVQIASGRSIDRSEFIQLLLKEEQMRLAREKVEAMLEKGLDSGPATPMTAADWDNLRQRMHERL